MLRGAAESDSFAERLLQRVTTHSLLGIRASLDTTTMAAVQKDTPSTGEPTEAVDFPISETHSTIDGTGESYHWRYCLSFLTRSM